MPVSIEWVNPEHTIIQLNFVGKWTWEEYSRVGLVDLPSIMETEPHTVHIISNLLQSGPLPTGGALSHARNVTNNLPPNWGILVLVNKNMVIDALVNVFRTAFKNGMGAKTYSVKTIEEAMLLIREEQSAV
jgi:hypothetical protein